MLIALVTTFSLQGSDEEPPITTPNKQVRTVPVENVDFRQTVFGTGRLASKEEVKLSFKTGGVIQKIQVEEGQRVRKGQLLAELQLTEISAQNRQAELATQQANINIENAKLAIRRAERDLKNVEGLYRDSVATSEDLDNAQIARDNAYNQLATAEAALQYNKQNIDIAAFNLSYSKIVAPVSGIVLHQLAEANELIGPGQPVLIIGSNERSPVIRVNITDKDIIHINTGDQAQIHFDPYPNDTFPGQVAMIASTANPMTGTYEVEIDVNAKGKKLLNGFIGQVYIQTKNTQALLRIPFDALTRADQNKGTVFVRQGDQALEKEVSIFKLENNSLLLNQGLQGGEEVIVEGAAYLQDGDKIDIIQPR